MNGKHSANKAQIILVFVALWLLILINKTVEDKTTALTLFGITAWWLGVFCEASTNNINTRCQVGRKETGKEKTKAKEKE